MKIFKKLKFSLIAILIIFTSCEKDETIETLQESADTEQQFIEKYFQGEVVKVIKLEDGTFSLQGSDIILFEHQFTKTQDEYDPYAPPASNFGKNNNGKLALLNGITKWSNNTVPYVVNGLSQTVRNELQKSIAEWESKTNVRFVPRTNQSTYVTISSNGDACNCGVATLGSNGSRGFIRLGTLTTAVVIIHELGHTLGYVHEQNRSDRDNFVIINYQNIQNGRENQFNKSSNQNLSAFDINSIMMYGSYTFSSNGRPTITDLNGNVLPRRQAAISALDVQGTNRAYPADDTDSCSDPLRDKVSASKLDITCDSNGSITTSISNFGSRRSVQYKLNNGSYITISTNESYTFTNLSAGNYTISARWGDQSCETQIGSVTITNNCNDDPTPPTTTCGDPLSGKIYASIINKTCNNNGSIIFSVRNFGTRLSVFYKLNNGNFVGKSTNESLTFNNLNAGNYTLTARWGDQSCEAVIGTVTVEDECINNNNPCNGISEWQSNRRYYVGDRVTYNGSLYERDFSRWNFIASCN